MDYNGPISKYESGKHLANFLCMNQVRSLPFVVFTGLLIQTHLFVTPRHVRVVFAVLECLAFFHIP
jgi:hypothetical protein